MRNKILDTVPEEALEELICLTSQICGTPIASVRLTEGHALRTFCVIDRRPRQFTDEQRQALTDLGGRP